MEKKSKISYILKSKPNSGTSTLGHPKIENDGKILLSTWTLKDTILFNYGLTKQQCVIWDYGLYCIIKVKDENSFFHNLCIQIHQSPNVTLVDVDISGRIKHNIEVLEAFDLIFSKETSDPNLKLVLSKQYDITKTFDDISSYYCNLIYKKLDAFDRKMRKLLYNTYYIVLGKNFSAEFKYYSSKGKLKRRKENAITKEPCDDNIFYMYDYSQLIDILFVDKRHTTENIEKTDWELFFQDKIPIKSAYEDISNLKIYRNKIAHCKLFSKADYKQTVKLLNKYTRAIDKAISLTYTNDFLKDFIKVFSASLEIVVKRFVDVLEKYQKDS
ncbi:MAG: hypothetical protein IKU23_08140 [Clostridia bacterium]|nr:hypothetical protein [Clostridia bacterium]